MAVMNALTFPILRLLADGKFHSGEAIARHFHVSRATVWNALQYAGQLGVEIFSVPGRGYKLPQPVTLLDAQTISGALDEYGTSLHVEVHDHLASTNSYLMQNIGTARHATCVAANLQTGGRGRRGRSWHAGLGASLTFSVLWRFQCGASALSGLSLAAGIALMRSLHGLGMTGTQLKWPNDVLIGRKKLAGILIELQGDMEGPSTAVIGMGINLNLPDKLKQQIDQPVTDLASLLNGELNPNHLLAALLKHLADVLTAFEQGGFAALRDEWTQHHAYHEKDVRMLMPDGREIHGVVKGITEDGSLLVATAAGMQRFISGEISLRGT